MNDPKNAVFQIFCLWWTAQHKIPSKHYVSFLADLLIQSSSPICHPSLVFLTSHGHQQRCLNTTCLLRPNWQPCAEKRISGVSQKLGQKGFNNRRRIAEEKAAAARAAEEARIQARIQEGLDDKTKQQQSDCCIIL